MIEKRKEEATAAATTAAAVLGFAVRRGTEEELGDDGRWKQTATRSRE